jgi:hypothetical protein
MPHGLLRGEHESKSMSPSTTVSWRLSPSSFTGKTSDSELWGQSTKSPNSAGYEVVAPEAKWVN